MKDAKFEREIRDLLYFIREYGIQHVNTSKEELQRDPGKFHAFIGSVHKGFDIAQKNVILNLSQVLKEKKHNKAAIKQANTNGNKALANELRKKQKRLDYQECAFRKVMDALAWQFLQCDISSVRRLYLGHTPIDITDSNLASCIEAAQKQFEENPMHFALINDLTTFVQVGDLMINKYGEAIILDEIKEGKTNDKVIEILQSFSESNCPRQLHLALDQETPKFQEQFSRFAKQMKTGHEVVQTMNTGQGIDPLSGQKITIIQDEIELECFDAVMLETLEKSKKKGYAISVVEDCLLIGVYESQRFDSRAFDAWAKSVNAQTPVFDMRSSLMDPMALPLYLQPFSEKDIIDIVAGRRIVKMAIVIDSWLQPLHEQGVTVEKMSRKKTTKLKQTISDGPKLIETNGQGIEIKKDGVSQILYGGLLSRMFTMLNTPSAMRKYIMSTFEHMKDLP